MDMVGSIANLSVAMSQNRLASDVSTAMLDKTMDTWKEQGASILFLQGVRFTPESVVALDDSFRE